MTQDLALRHNAELHKIVNVKSDWSYARAATWSYTRIEIFSIHTRQCVAPRRIATCLCFRVHNFAQLRITTQRKVVHHIVNQAIG